VVGPLSIIAAIESGEDILIDPDRFAETSEAMGRLTALLNKQMAPKTSTRREVNSLDRAGADRDRRRR
jgi:hypothetical protein